MRITRKLLEERLDARIREYEDLTQYNFDYSDGQYQVDHHRVALGNDYARALVIYGQIDELRNLLED